MKRISVAIAVVACLGSGAALACEDMVMKDSMAFAPNASQKPLVVKKAEPKAVATQKSAKNPTAVANPNNTRPSQGSVAPSPNKSS